jgi:DNA-binding GntR family transcriptional regulator
MSNVQHERMEEANGGALGMHRTVSASVAASLREDIVSGQLESGTRLRQVELARRFGVSTTPVREALAALQSEGLVRVHPQRGAVVFVPTIDGLREHYEIRAALEALAAERAAERFDPARGEALSAMLDEMAAGPGVERYLELNLRFHSELYALAGRPRLVEMIETLRDASSAYLHIYATRDFPSAAERLDAEHREILAACREGEPLRAAAAVRHHLRQTVEHVARRLERDAG